MKEVFSRVRDVFPQSLTILPTYRCNAACKECCFESNPAIKQRLSLAQIKKSVTEAKDNFYGLQLIVFSGGEAFLLKEDLYEAIAHARSLGLRVRCVTNGFWGKTMNVAQRTVVKLREAGVSEINISTGADHQEWVPVQSVINACVALVAEKITTLVTVEKDSVQTNCLEMLRQDERIRRLVRHHPRHFSIQCNAWMPFHENYEERGEAAGLESLTSGCSQVFNNIVITPYNKLAACCGLTFEHIPEMTIGDMNNESMVDSFNDSIKDFLKIWIHLDGPGEIMRKLFGSEINEELRHIRHICQACAVLHLHPRVRDMLRQRYHEFVPDVTARFALKVEMLRREIADLKRVVV